VSEPLTVKNKLVTKHHKEGWMLWINDVRNGNMDMRFGTWNIWSFQRQTPK
jgi:hypothetical protein